MSLLRTCCRFASPSTLLLALLLFPLPWVEIQCPGKATTLKQRLTADRHIVHTQSGWQALWGQWSDAEPRDYATLTKEDRDHVERLRRHMPTAPLLVLYIGLILAGLAVALIGRSAVWRPILVGGCVAVALAIIAVQRWHGLPLDRSFRAGAWETAAEGNSPRETAEIEDELRRSIRYTGWFWLAQYSLALALGLSGVEWWYARWRAEFQSDNLSVAPLEVAVP